MHQGRQALTQVSAFNILYFLFESYLFRGWGRSNLPSVKRQKVTVQG